MLVKRVLFMAMFAFMFMVALPAQAQTISVPAILYFKSDTNSVQYTEVEAGTAAANFSWNVVGMTDDYYLQMHAWVGEQWGVVGERFEAKKTDRIVIAHPQDFGLPTYRLSVVNSQGVIVASSYLQMNYSAPEPDERPNIAVFTSTLTEVNANELTDGKVFIPIHWSIEKRWAEVNPVFEQVMPDGQAVSIELPRRNLWLPALGDGIVTPLTNTTDSVILQMRLVDVVTDQTLDARQITLPVNESAALTDTTTDSGSSDGHAYPGVSRPITLTAVPTAVPQNVDYYDPKTPGFYFQSDRTEIVDDNHTVTLSWNAPGGTQVWIEMHQLGTSFCNKIYHPPGQVFGPLQASGSLPVSVPDSYLFGAWFEIYVDRYTAATCDKRGDLAGKVEVDAPVLKPGEFFTANATKIDDGNNNYIVTPGDWVDLSWLIKNGMAIHFGSYYNSEITPSVEVAANGSMRVCPRPGWNYYTLVFGDVESSSLSVSLVLNVSDSQDYPANRGEGNPCWKTP